MDKSKKYINNYGRHIKEKHKFIGNCYYSSLNALSFGNISRKDNLIKKNEIKIKEKIDKLGYFFDYPNYDDYINILKKSIKTEKIDYNYFIWEKKLMPKFNNIKNRKIIIQDDNEIKLLYKGYPAELILKIAKKYNNN